MNPLKFWRPALFVIAGPGATAAAMLIGLAVWQALAVGTFVTVAAGLALFRIEAG